MFNNSTFLFISLIFLVPTYLFPQQQQYKSAFMRPQITMPIINNRQTIHVHSNTLNNSFPQMNQIATLPTICNPLHSNLLQNQINNLIRIEQQKLKQLFTVNKMLNSSPQQFTINQQLQISTMLNPHIMTNNFYQKPIPLIQVNVNDKLRKSSKKGFTLANEMGYAKINQFNGIRNKKIRKQKNYTCGHFLKRHYAKGMCHLCYQRQNRKRKPKNCPHDRLYAFDRCFSCYRVYKLKMQKEKADKLKDSQNTESEQLTKYKQVNQKDRLWKQNDQLNDLDHMIKEEPKSEKGEKNENNSLVVNPNDLQGFFTQYTTKEFKEKMIDMNKLKQEPSFQESTQSQLTPKQSDQLLKNQHMSVTLQQETPK